MRLLSTNSIFYPPYIISAFVFALIWLQVSQRKTLKDSFSSIFSLRVWLRAGTAIDLACCIFYIELWQSWVQRAEGSIFRSVYTELSAFGASKTWGFESPVGVAIESCLATLITMLSLDFASYLTHAAMHRWSLFWIIHKTHHSATELTPLTTFRQNPLEPLLLNGMRALFAGIGLGTFHLFFAQRSPVYLIEGMGAGIFLYMFTVNLHHAPIPVRYPLWLRKILISPHIHHLHHSSAPRHAGKNLGVIFSIWDRVFGTYYDEKFEMGELRFGNADQLPESLPSTARA